MFMKANATARGATRLKRSSVEARLVAATVVGNGLELYDFTIFSFFSVLLSGLYFPRSAPTS